MWIAWIGRLRGEVGRKNLQFYNYSQQVSQSVLEPFIPQLPILAIFFDNWTERITHGTSSSSSANSSSMEISSRSSLSFWSRLFSIALFVGCLAGYNVSGYQWLSGTITCLAFSCSSRVASRWCKRLNRLIFSWSSRRTSFSSLPPRPSSSRESCKG